MTDAKLALILIAVVVLILGMHTMDWHWRVAPSAKPIKSGAAEMAAPQCRQFRNGREYKGWVWLQRDGGAISGGCLYEKKGVRL